MRCRFAVKLDVLSSAHRAGSYNHPFLPFAAERLLPCTGRAGRQRENRPRVRLGGLEGDCARARANPASRPSSGSLCSRSVGLGPSGSRGPFGAGRMFPETAATLARSRRRVKLFLAHSIGPAGCGVFLASPGAYFPLCHSMHRGIDGSPCPHCRSRFAASRHAARQSARGGTHARHARARRENGEIRVECTVIASVHSTLRVRAS